MAMDPAAATLEAIERYAPDIEVPPPAVLEQARRNLGLRVAMLREFGAVGVAALAELSGSKARRPSTVVDNWRRARRVVTVRWHGETLVPGFLVSAGGRPDPAAQPALAVLVEQGFSDWQAVLWWVVPNTHLDGVRPVDVLLGAREADPPARDEAAQRLAAAARRRRDWF